MKTKYEAKVAFSLSKFSNSKIIEWKFNLAERENLGYDMIIGRDLLGQLGMIIDYKNKLIEWEGTKIPMRDYDRLHKLNLSSKELNAILRNTKGNGKTSENSRFKLSQSKFDGNSSGSYSFK